MKINNKKSSPEPGEDYFVTGIYPCMSGTLQFLEVHVAELVVGLAVSLVGPRFVRVLRHVRKKILLHVGQHFRKSFLELLEVFLVEENLVLVE